MKDVVTLHWSFCLSFIHGGTNLGCLGFIDINECEGQELALTNDYTP